MVPILNEAGCIEGTLNQLLAQSYDPACFEILVVDGQSSDGTQELVRKFADRYPNVQLLDNPRRLSSAARNIGIRHAAGDIVLVVDGHCEIENDHLLANVAEAFATSGADCVGRPQPLDIRAASPLQRAIAAARSSRLGHHPDSFTGVCWDDYTNAFSKAGFGFGETRWTTMRGITFGVRIDHILTNEHWRPQRCWVGPDVGSDHLPVIADLRLRD